MDKTDEKILDLIKGNARMTYQEIGDFIGISRVAAMKRVRKLEESGIIKKSAAMNCPASCCGH